MEQSLSQQKLAFRRHRQLDSLYSQAGLALIASIVCGSVLAAIMYGSAPSKNLIVWCSAMIGVAVARYFVITFYNRHDFESLNARRWRFLFVATLFASGAAWGAASYLIAPSTAVADQAIVVIFICGFVAAAVAAFSVDRLAFGAFASPALGLPAINLIMSSESSSQALAGVLLMFGGFLLANALRSHEAHKRDFDTQHDKHVLTAKLEDEKAKISELADDLEIRVNLRTEELTLINRELNERIAEKNNAVEEIKIQESRFMAVFDQAPIGMLVVHADSGVVVRANSIMCQFLGYDKKELDGMLCEQLLCPSERVERNGASIFEQKEGVERRYLHRRGFVLWGRTSTSELAGAQLGDTHYVIQVEDLSELKRARDDLTDRNDALETAFQAAPVGVAVIDNSGRILNDNVHLRSILNLDGDLSGRSLTSILNARDEAHNSGVLARLFSGELDSVEFEHQLFGIGETSKHVVVRITRVKGRNVGTQFAVAHIRDKSVVQEARKLLPRPDDANLIALRASA